MEETKRKRIEITKDWNAEERKGKVGVFEGNLLVAVVGECVSRPEYRLPLAQRIVTAVNCHDELLDTLKVMVETRVRHSIHALHPSKRFCDQCGQNSKTAVHVEGCPVGIAETVIARAEQIEGEGKLKRGER